MRLKNNSTKIIGIGEMSILPGETEKCPEGYAKNPVILRYIANGTFSKIEDADVHSAPADKRLEDMTEDELIRYAVENSIDIGKATTKEGILKKVQDAKSA